MAVIIAEDFEAGLGAWTLNGVPTTGAAAANTGAAGLICNATAATQYVQQTLPGGTRILTGRMYFQIASLPTSNINIVQGNNASGDMKLTLLTTGVLRAQVGSGTTQVSSALSTSTWYRIDWKYDTTGATATVDWQIDGSAQTQATRAQAAADMSQFRLGILNASTAHLRFDTLAVRDTATEYPLGVVPLTASADVASGTGTTFTVSSGELVASGGNSSGSGTAATVTPTILAPIASASGVGAVGAVALSMSAPPGVASGTGTAATVTPTILAPIAVATGTGAAFNPDVATTIGGTSLVITMG